MPDAYHLGSHDVLRGYHAMLLNDPHRMDAYEASKRRSARALPPAATVTCVVQVAARHDGR